MKCLYCLSTRPFPPVVVPRLVVASLVIAGSAWADTLHVPDDYESIGHAAVVAASGDTILVAPGLQNLAGSMGFVDVTLSSGVVLLAEQPDEQTEIFVGYGEDALILADDGPDTTIVEGLIFNFGDHTVGIDVHTPAAIVRDNLFFGLNGGPGRTVRLRVGGVVEGNSFKTAGLWGIVVEDGEALIQYNTFNSDCYWFGFFAVFVYPAAGSEIDLELRNNTFRGALLEIGSALPAPRVLAINNIFEVAEVRAGSNDEEHSVLHFVCNLFSVMSWNLGDEVEVTLGEGNLDWDEEPPIDYTLYCFGESGHEACDLTIDKGSPVAEAGENGETLGANPIACGFTPIDGGEGPGHAVDIATRVGEPRPNPSPGVVRLPVSSLRDDRITVYDAAGRRVHVLDVGKGAREVVWDGRDDADRPVSSGTYFIRGPEGTTRTVRIVR